MSLAKSFSEEQIARLQAWADEGDNLSGIQKKLATDMGVKVTYLELRFLIDDLGIKLKEEEKPEPPKEDEDAGGQPDADGGSPTGDGVVVEISALQRPGSMINGTAKFAGGEQMEWWVDQMGQLGIDPKNPGFRPTAEQMRSFQMELQRAVRGSGGL